MELFRFLRKKGLEKRAEKKSKKDGLLESGLFENYKSEDLREYLPSLAMRILKELCEISPYICENLDKKKENYQAILKYLKDIHNPKKYASPQALRRAIGASTSTRLTEKMDDILAAEAAKIRDTLPKDSLEALKRTLEADKKFNLRKKLLRFLDSKDLGMKALLDGVGYSEKELEKLIKNSSDLDDIEQKKKASEALRTLVDIKSKVLMQAEKVYERFIKTGALPEEEDFRCVRNKNVFYNLSFVEDRIISRIMAFASDRMSQYAKANKKAAKKAARSQVAAVKQEKVQERKVGAENQDSEKLAETAKQILLDELRKVNSERRYLPKNTWPTGKNTGPVYKEAIEAYFEYFKGREKFNDDEVAQVIEKYCIELAANSSLKEQTVKTIIKQVERAYKNIFKDIGAKGSVQDSQAGKKESMHEKVKVRKSGWKTFMIGGASALALTALTFAGYKGYVSFSERARVEFTQPESEKSKDSDQILKEAQCKAKIKEINALLDSLYTKLQKQILLNRAELRKLQGEVSQLKEDLRKNKELAQGVRKDLDELNKKLKSTSALLNKRNFEKTSSIKDKTLNKADSLSLNKASKSQKQDRQNKRQSLRYHSFSSHGAESTNLNFRYGRLVPFEGESFEYILREKFQIAKRLKKAGLNDLQIRQSFFLLEKTLEYLFKNGVLDYRKYGFPTYNLDYIWAYKGLALADLLNEEIYYKGRKTSVIDFVFSRQNIQKFSVKKLSDFPHLDKVAALFKDSVESLLK